jgi:hypothetical protein
MKKSVFGMLAVLIAATFSQCNCRPSTITGKTLNGIDEVTAGKMMQHFEDLKGNDKAPLTETFWISKEMIHDIVTLLHSEIKQQKAQGRKDTTDGVRIYFASDPTISSYPLSNTILLVSTKDNGKADTNIIKGCRSGRRHLDYYDHVSSDDLFKLSNHEIKCESAGCPGDSLYPPATVSNPHTSSHTRHTTSTCDLPHGIPREEAEEMVKYFLEPHIINTSGEWFDLCFFETIDKSPRPNGIRIYFARHANKDDDISKLYRDAFVITTTERDTLTGITKDYFDCDKISRIYEEAYNLKYTKSHGLYSGPQDNGELCPYNCN